MKKELTFLFVATLCVFSLSSVACRKDEPARSTEAAGNTLNDGVDATRNALKKVAEGINNAVDR